MTTPSKIMISLLATSVLAACSTVEFKDAEPEKFAALDCEQLDLLSESYRPTYEAQLFANTDNASMERGLESGASRRLGETRPGSRPYEEDIERDRRSIAVARRQKGCI